MKYILMNVFFPTHSTAIPSKNFTNIWYIGLWVYIIRNYIYNFFKIKKNV